MRITKVNKMHNLNWLRQEFVNKGVWIRPFLDVIYIMPPFTIKDHEDQIRSSRTMIFKYNL